MDKPKLHEHQTLILEWLNKDPTLLIAMDLMASHNMLGQPIEAHPARSMLDKYPGVCATSIRKQRPVIDYMPLCNAENFYRAGMGSKSDSSIAVLFEQMRKATRIQKFLRPIPIDYNSIEKRTQRLREVIPSFFTYQNKLYYDGINKQYPHYVGKLDTQETPLAKACGFKVPKPMFSDLSAITTNSWPWPYEIQRMQINEKIYQGRL